MEKIEIEINKEHESARRYKEDNGREERSYNEEAEIEKIELLSIYYT